MNSWPLESAQYLIAVYASPYGGNSSISYKVYAWVWTSNTAALFAEMWLSVAVTERQLMRGFPTGWASEPRNTLCISDQSRRLE